MNDQPTPAPEPTIGTLEWEMKNLATGNKSAPEFAEAQGKRADELMGVIKGAGSSAPEPTEAHRRLVDVIRQPFTHTLNELAQLIAESERAALADLHELLTINQNSLADTIKERNRASEDRDRLCAEVERYNQQLADKAIYASSLERERATLRAEVERLKASVFEHANRADEEKCSALSATARAEKAETEANRLHKAGTDQWAEFRTQIHGLEADLELARSEVTEQAARANRAETALRSIKLTCLTAKEGPKALAHIVRLCIDAGVSDKLDALEASEQPKTEPESFSATDKTGRNAGPKYTPETHPWRGRVFIIHEPGVFRLDGKPYCPTAWIVTPVKDQHPCAGIIAVQNAREDCIALIESWGGKVFQPKTEGGE